MSKRGQVTAFILVGIVVLAILGFVFYARGYFSRISIGGESGQRYVNSQLESITEYLDDCVNEVVEDDLKLLIDNAGFFQLTSYYIIYEGGEVNYLIYEIDGEKVNGMNLKSYIEDQISDHVKNKLVNECTLKEYEDQFTLNRGNINVDTLIVDEKILVVLDYPVTVVRGDVRGEIREVEVDIDTDFGKIYDAVTDIVNGEMENGDFDKNSYELSHRDIVIRKDNLYLSDAVYSITTTEDGEDEFVIFAVRR